MKVRKTLKRMFSLLMVFSMLMTLATPVRAAQDRENAIAFEKVDNSLVPSSLSNRKAEETSNEAVQVEYGDTDIVRVSIILEEPSAIEAGYSTEDIASNDSAMEYRDELQSLQDTMTDSIEGVIGEELDVVWNLTLAANLISAYVEYGQIEEIETLAGVDSVVLETIYEASEADISDVSNPQMATSSSMIDSTTAYMEGYTGAGTRIAIIDTGIDTDHQSFDDGAYEYALKVLADKAGIEYEEYVNSLNLLTVEEIEGVADYLNASYNNGFEADKTYLTSKIPYAYNYVDSNYIIDHDHDSQGEHGSHVAGIAAANSYIPNGDGTYSSALETVLTQGVAPEAQIITMKVFGAGGGAYDSDMMAAIEDAIILGCDSINLSIGSSNPGFSSTEYQAMLDCLTSSDSVVCISAGNYGAWAEYSYNANGYIYADDVSMQTSGNPGSYTNSLNVASVENTGFTGKYIKVGENLIFYTEATGYGNKEFSTLAGNREYILIDGYGSEEEFSALSDVLEGKIAICSRGGGINFYDKAQYAVRNGAVAAIIYNNVSGTISMDLTGYQETAPCVSITQEDADVLRRAADAVLDDEGNVLYYEGTLSVSEEDGTINYDSDYYTMSDFSSWGVPGSLELKPEITAPGGNIYSVNGIIPGGTSYETMSGTSMASPQVAGMAALVAQYIKANGLNEQTGLSIRVLTQSLLMSTAEPVYEEASGGNYYSVLQQGAGLANVGAAIKASSYILMNEDATDSYADGKVKAELGDDPERTGSYTFSFTINNLTDSEETYDLSADLFTQDLFADYVNYEELGLYLDKWTSGLSCGAVWTVDGKTLALAEELYGLDFNGDGLVNANDGQALLDYATGVRKVLTNEDKADLNGDGEINSYDSYLFFLSLNTGYAVVPANGSVEVQVTLELTDTQKEELNEYYSNGAYIEGYVYATALTTPEGVAGTSHSIPVLGFYGNWTDASMYDVGSYTQYVYGEETRWDYLGNLFANYVSVNYSAYGTFYFGGNPAFEEEYYDSSRNAISVANGDSIYQAGYALIRNAAAGTLTITNKTTGEVEYERLIGQTYGAYCDVSSEVWYSTSYTSTLNFTPKGEEGDSYELSLTMVPEYYVDDEGNVDWDALGRGATLSMPFTIDNTAPEVTEVEGSIFYTDNGQFTVTVTDNQYFAGADLYDSNGEYLDSFRGEESEDGTEWTFTVDLAGNGWDDGVYLLQVYDYALNSNTYRIFNNTEITDVVEKIVLSDDYLKMMAGSSTVLTATVLPSNIEDDTVTWTSSDEKIAAVNKNGVISAVSEGYCIITATSNQDETVSASCQVEVKAIDKTLNGIIWDENGDVWWSEFNSKTLPEYTKLTNEPEDNYFDAATLAVDGTLYASMTDYDYTGVLYKVDPDNNFEATEIGSAGSSWAGVSCVDIAEAPTSVPEGLLGVYGPYVICIDKETGEYTYWLYQYSNNLVGITYLGSYTWSYDDTTWYVDAYYLIDELGNVYYQEFDNGYYYYYNESGDYSGYMCSTGVSAPYSQYCSAYYDDEYLYWSVFDGGISVLYAIDDYMGEAYRLGDFGESVWPAVGLMELGIDGFGNGMNVVDRMGHSAEQIGQAALDGSVPENDERVYGNKLSGSLNSIVEDGAVNDAGEELENAYTVSVTAKDADGVEIDSTNGVINVTYDSDKLELQRITFSGDCSYTSINSGDGNVTLGYVALGEGGIAAGKTVADLVFVPKQTHMDSFITIAHTETGDEVSDYEEVLSIAFVEHSYGEPIFTWSEDNTACTAEFICSICGETKSLTCEVTSQITPATESEDGSIVYTAIVELDGKIYTSTVTEALPRRDVTDEDNGGDDITDGNNAGDGIIDDNDGGDSITDNNNAGDGSNNIANDTLDNPNTGDNLNSRLWISLAVLSFAGVSILEFAGYKRRKEKKS